MNGYGAKDTAGLLEAWGAPVDIIAGDRKLFQGDNSQAALVFADESVASHVLGKRDALAFAEAYVHGEMDIKGDIYAAVMLKDQFYPERLGLRDKGRIVFNVLRGYNRHTLNNDRKFISHHYEHPDDFYRLFLGKSMTYSCAYFAAENDSLDAAQENKIDHLLAKLRIKFGDRLLDIGCGWGSLVVKAAQDYGAKPLGVTLSKSQHAYADQRIRELGLEGNCQVELLDYRQLDPNQEFDKIVSVGMYEHVGGRNLNAYFKKVHELLRPDGLVVNHGITTTATPDWRKSSEARFIDKYIFPGGELYPVNHVIKGMELAGFEVFDVESLRRHYAKTLRHWVDNLRRRAGEASELVPESVYRAWVLYMAGCALTFEEGYLNVHQVCGSKTRRFGGREIPLTRAHLYRKS